MPDDCSIPNLPLQIYRCPDAVDVIDGLALEAALFEALPPNRMVLYLWRAKEAVVIGRNQNPWRECAVTELAASAVPLARRQSGGGAVYHDPGNLNYTIMMPQPIYNACAVGRLVCQGLQRCGVDARLSERHVLSVAGQKCSGTAFAFRRNRVLHHGTILLEADLDRLHRFLKPDLPTMQTRAVASVPSPVVNLSDLQPQLTAEAIFDAIHAVFAESAANATEADPAAVDGAKVAEFANLYHTWDWHMGKTPAFEVTLGGYALRVESGLVVSATQNGGDAPHLTGVPFDGSPLGVLMKKNS
jgi:lipoate-protein ligase A